MCAHLAGNRLNCATCDLSAILPEEVEQELKEAAEISMGTEVSEGDIFNVSSLCEQVRGHRVMSCTDTCKSYYLVFLLV